MTNRTAAAVLMAALALPAVAQATPVAASTQRPASEEGAELYARGRRALAAGRAVEAEALFRRAVETDPRNVPWNLALAEALIAQKRLADAEAVMEATPASGSAREVALLLAQVRLWRGRSLAAAEGFRTLIAANPRDIEAREGLATALYWSGDWPAAAREYREVLRLQPKNNTALAALEEIKGLSAATAEAAASYARDDQPYRRARSHVAFSPAAESLTRWRIDAGSYFLDYPDSGISRTAPFAAVRVTSSAPRWRLTSEAWARALRFPDGETKILGGGALRRRLSSNSNLALQVDQRELLYTYTSLLSHPSVTAVSLRWDLEQPGGWYAAAYAEALRYFDENSGLSVGGYAAVPVVRAGGLTLLIGAGASYRDTDETRFRLESVSSVPVGGGTFQYTYRGVYDPYWTPLDTTEARAVAVLQWSRPGGTTLRVNADGGVARETVTGFGPERGSTPLPFPGSAPFERTIYPWRAGLELVRPIGTASSISIGYEHFVTAFYVSDEVAARFIRRF
jgi:Tfp pilus assembly protein PilF